MHHVKEEKCLRSPPRLRLCHGQTESTHITPFLMRWLGSPGVKFWLSPHGPASVSKVRPCHLHMRAHLAIPPISGLRKGPFLQEDPLDHDLCPLSRQVHCKSLPSPLQRRCLAPWPHTASDKPTASEASPGSWIQAGSRVYQHSRLGTSSLGEAGTRSALPAAPQAHLGPGGRPWTRCPQPPQ